MNIIVIGVWNGYNVHMEDAHDTIPWIKEWN